MSSKWHFGTYRLIWLIINVGVFVGCLVMVIINVAAGAAILLAIGSFLMAFGAILRSSPLCRPMDQRQPAGKHDPKPPAE